MSSTTATATIAISAPPDDVWDVVTDFESYTEWKSGILEIEGDAAVGESIRLRSEVDPDRTFRLKVTELDGPHRMVLSGGVPLGLFTANRAYEIVPTKKGSQFTMTETIGGLLKPLISSSIPNLQPSFDLYCGGLEAEVRRRRAS